MFFSEPSNLPISDVAMSEPGWGWTCPGNAERSWFVAYSLASHRISSGDCSCPLPWSTLGHILSSLPWGAPFFPNLTLWGGTCLGRSTSPPLLFRRGLLHFTIKHPLFTASTTSLLQHLTHPATVVDTRREHALAGGGGSALTELGRREGFLGLLPLDGIALSHAPGYPSLCTVTWQTMQMLYPCMASLACP